MLSIRPSGIFIELKRLLDAISGGVTEKDWSEISQHLTTNRWPSCTPSSPRTIKLFCRQSHLKRNNKSGGKNHIFTTKIIIQAIIIIRVFNSLPAMLSLPKLCHSLLGTLLKVEDCYQFAERVHSTVPATYCLFYHHVFLFHPTSHAILPWLGQEFQPHRFQLSLLLGRKNRTTSIQENPLNNKITRYVNYFFPTKCQLWCLSLKTTDTHVEIFNRACCSVTDESTHPYPNKNYWCFYQFIKNKPTHHNV